MTAEQYLNNSKKHCPEEIKVLIDLLETEPLKSVVLATMDDYADYCIERNRIVNSSSCTFKKYKEVENG